MKTSISLANGKKMNYESWLEIAKIVKNAGFDGIDLDLCAAPADVQAVAKLPAYAMEQADAAKAAGLEISMCHFTYWGSHLMAPGNGTYEDFEKTMLPIYLQSLEICGQIGCKVAVVHPYICYMSDEGTVDGNVRMLKKMLPYMEKHDVRIALENLFFTVGDTYLPCPISRADVILKIIQAVDSPLVGACLDTGHAHINGQDMVQMAKIYGKHLIALHVHGNAGKDEHVIPYTMSDWCELMDFHAFSSALREIGYCGTYNLEVAVGALPASVVQPYYNFAAAVARALANEAE